MSIQHTPQTRKCPTCRTEVEIINWSRPPRETTHEQLMPTHRTFEPGPEADVYLSCGHEIHGIDGVKFLATGAVDAPTAQLDIIERVAGLPDGSVTMAGIYDHQPRSEVTYRIEPINGGEADRG